VQVVYLKAKDLKRSPLKEQTELSLKLSLIFYLRAAFILFRLTDLWYNINEKGTSTSGNGRVVFFSLFMIFYLCLLSDSKKTTTIFSFSL